MAELLRYTGTRPVSFLTGHVGLVGPGGEFSVPEDLAPRFLRRADVERAGEDGPPDGGDGTAGDSDDDGAAGTPAGPDPDGPEAVTLQRAE